MSSKNDYPKTRSNIKKKNNKTNTYDSIIINSDNNTQRTVSNMPSDINKCPCGGGQSCIVDRRCMGDIVHEDIVFKNLNIKLRKNCYEPMTQEQQDAICKSMQYNE